MENMYLKCPVLSIKLAVTSSFVGFLKGNLKVFTISSLHYIIIISRKTTLDIGFPLRPLL